MRWDKVDRYYIGKTTETFAERVRKHNSAHRGFTGKFNDWAVKYSEEFSSKARAYKRELDVKAWKSRSRIEALIAGSEHPARHAGGSGVRTPQLPQRPG